MPTITNPILPGFNPDPAICRVGDDFYIATSTFQWFPGVQIHHSKDLVNWQLITRPLDRLSQLDMRGDIDSGGIWAPCLTYADGLFWLIYTDVKIHTAPWKDTPNYLVTAENIEGPWSEPIYLNSSGFDPSLFHDDDGKKWHVNMIWDHRPEKNRFAGIVLQEYDHAQQKLVGPITNISPGSYLQCTEGPHLYKNNGYYYLMVAEGGTGFNHAVSVARSKTIEGPYEYDPQTPVITAVHDENLTIQRAGHGSLVDTQDGRYYIAHLCGRPLPGLDDRRCMLGRETAIQEVQWTEDGWLRLLDNTHNPKVEVDAPDLPAHPFEPTPIRDDFDSEQIGIHYQSLRIPMTSDWMSLTDRPGHLRLYGKESLTSKHTQALIGRRIQHFECEVKTSIEFNPTTFQQNAGLLAYYDCSDWRYLRITHDEAKGRLLGVEVMDDDNYTWEDQVEIPDGVIHLGFKLNYHELQFCYSLDGENWQNIGPVQDSSKLSDEYGHGWKFTGAFAALCCQDMSGQNAVADFDYFSYEEI